MENSSNNLRLAKVLSTEVLAATISVVIIIAFPNLAVIVGRWVRAVMDKHLLYPLYPMLAFLGLQWRFMLYFSRPENSEEGVDFKQWELYNEFIAVGKIALGVVVIGLLATILLILGLKECDDQAIGSLCICVYSICSTVVATTGLARLHIASMLR